MIEQLGLEPHDPVETLKDTVDSLMMWGLTPAKRRTYFVRRRVREHMRVTLWGATQGSGMFGDTLTDARAELLATWAPRYWPDEGVVRAWLLEHWAAWRRAPPDWFDDGWIKFIPASWRPPPQMLSDGEGVPQD